MALRPAALLLVLGLAVGSGAGCGGERVGGHGSFAPAPGPGGGAHLTLSGTPYEQGWWHGSLLKQRILALHEVWQREAFASDGDLLSPATRERRSAALLLVEPVLARLPEALRQEYDGLSAATGLPVRTLLLTELLTDVLRFTESEPRIVPGSVGAVPSVGPRSLGLRLGAGPWRARLSGELLWITRRAPAGGRAVTALAWPGSLGALLAARGDGVAAAAVEVPLPREEQLLSPVPFGLALRTALEAAADASDVWPRLARGTGHDVVVVSLATGEGRRQRLAHVEGEAGPVPLLPAAEAGAEAGPAAPSALMGTGLAALAGPVFCVAAAGDGYELAWGGLGLGPDRRLRLP